MRRLLISSQKNTCELLVLNITKLHAYQRDEFRRNGVVYLNFLQYFGTKTCWAINMCKFDMQNRPMQRTFASHVRTNFHDEYVPSLSSSNGSMNLYTSASVDESNQWEKMKSKKPSKRYASNRSHQEWERLHCKIMQKSTFEVRDIINAEQCMRWWIFQCRAFVQKTKKDRTSINRFKSKQRIDDESRTIVGSTHGVNASKAIVSALDLFGNIVSALEAQPELLEFDFDGNVAASDNAMNHWYDGHLPRATHLLNAILDAWRLCWLDSDSDNRYLPTPQAIFTLLKDNWCDRVPMNERTYSIVIDAPVATMSPLRNTALQQEVPIFCEEVISFMLEKKIPKHISEHARPFYAEYSTLPDSVTYATALNAWARSGRIDAAERAIALFSQFTALCSDGTLPTMPNTFCYNTVLVAMSAPPKALVKQRSTLLSNARNMEQKIDQKLVDNVLSRHNALLLAEDMFRSMQLCPYPNVMLDTISFRTMIYSWAEYSVDLRYVDQKKSQNAMDRAVALLYEMAKLQVTSYNSAIDIDYRFFGKIISTLALNQPQIIDDFAKSDLRRAEEVYQYMLDLYRRTRDKRFIPDTTLLCAMTLVYAKDGRPLEAEAILTRLENEARSGNQLYMLPRISYYRGTFKHRVISLFIVYFYTVSI